MAATKITAPQVAPGWKILSISEVAIEREETGTQGCTSSLGHQNIWDQWNCHGNVRAEFGPPVPYWTPWGGTGTLSITIATAIVRIFLTIFPDGSTKIPTPDVTTTPF